MTTMTQHNVMLDIETLAKTDNAVILSIGAVLFNPNHYRTTQANAAQYLLFGGGDEQVEVPHDRILDRFYQAIEIKSQMDRYIDPETLDWWSQPNQAAAWSEYLASQRTDLDSALNGFAHWLSTVTKQDRYCRIWANAPSFDCRIVNHALTQRAGEKCWTYTQERCYRTIKSMDWRKQLLPALKNTAAHNALADAEWQAIHLQNIVEYYQLPLE